MNRYSVLSSGPSIYPVRMQLNLTDEMLIANKSAPYWILILSGGICVVGNRDSSIDTHLDMMSVRGKGIDLDWYEDGEPFVLLWDLSMGSDDLDNTTQ